MSTDREPFDTLVALAPPAPVDPAGLERAHARATATIRSGGTTRLQAVARRRVRSHRIVGATVLAVTAATVSVVVPSLDLGSTGDTGPAPLFWGVQPAAAEAAGCLNTLMPVPAPVEPETLVARDAWATIPAISRALWTIPGRTLSHADVRQSPAACGAVPIAVLYDTDPQRGITVYRDVAPVFPGEPNLFDPVTVQGHPGQVLTAAAQVHHLTWVDGSGVRWYVDAHGVSVDQLVTVLDDSLDADGLAAVPEGFTSARLPAPDPSATVYRWSARYTDGSYLEVTTPHRTAVQRDVLPDRPTDRRDHRRPLARDLPPAAAGGRDRCRAPLVGRHLRVPPRPRRRQPRRAPAPRRESHAARPRRPCPHRRALTTRHRARLESEGAGR